MTDTFEDKLEGLIQYKNQVLVMVNRGEYLLETGVISECYTNHNERWYKITPLNLWFKESELDEYK